MAKCYTHLIYDSLISQTNVNIGVTIPCSSRKPLKTFPRPALFWFSKGNSLSVHRRAGHTILHSCLYFLLFGGKKNLTMKRMPVKLLKVPTPDLLISAQELFTLFDILHR